MPDGPGQPPITNRSSGYALPRFLAHDLRPAAPAVEARQAVGPHDPDEAHAGEAGLQRTDDVDGVLRAQPALRVRDDHAAAAGEAAGAGHAALELGGLVAGLQR